LSSVSVTFDNIRFYDSWGPVAPTGVPHVNTKDDIYEGFHIPKGAIFLPNVFGITHDEADYPEPNDFRPERYLDPKPRDDIKDIVFGYGRRICPGMKLADLTLWISVAMTLSVFDLKSVEGEPPTFKYTNGIATYVLHSHSLAIVSFIHFHLATRNLSKSRSHLDLVTLKN
jgi:cytochrome P450